MLSVVVVVLLTTLELFSNFKRHSRDISTHATTSSSTFLFPCGRVQKCQIPTTCRPSCIVFVCACERISPLKFMLSLSAMFDIWRYNCPKATHRQAGSKIRKGKVQRNLVLGVVQQPEREPNRTCAVACSGLRSWFSGIVGVVVVVDDDWHLPRICWAVFGEGPGMALRRSGSVFCYRDEFLRCIKDTTNCQNRNVTFQFN